MINITNSSDCCGCTACASVCAHNAITMKPDALGFLYPEVDKQKCVNCSLCEQVCSFNEDYDKKLNLDKPIAYAVRHKNMCEIETSRSGGAFIAFSDWILEKGGVVYGVGYTGHFKAIHKRATTKEERDEFKGSKYVQSDMNTVFKQVKEDLKKGLEVLFSGTPCQTSGLISFLGDRYRTKLYVIDIVCHGVSSPYIWNDYLIYLENKERKKLTSVNFRDKKEFGWKAHRESFVFNNSYKYTYKNRYYNHIMFRHSCSICYFSNIIRPSDVTIADFWGWEKVDPNFNADNKGCSLVLCNTEKALEWFGNICEMVNYIPAKLEDCMQPNLIRPTVVNDNRMQFEKLYQTKGFLYTMRYFALMGWKYNLKFYKNKIIINIKNIFSRNIGRRSSI